MEIKRDCANRKLWLNQRKYVETILQRFNMHGSKPVKVPIPIGVKLSVDQCNTLFPPVCKKITILDRNYGKLEDVNV
jgi:hypothetical protein